MDACNGLRKMAFMHRARFAVAIMLGATMIGATVASPASAQWSGSADVDAMTDFVGWMAQVSGSGTGGAATLVVRCIDNRTDVLVSTDLVLGGSLDDRTEVRLRFDSAPAETQSWLRSTSYRAAFAIDRIGLARRLAHTEAKELRVRVAPFDSAGVDFVFSLNGARAQIEKVARLCGWSLSATAKPARKGGAAGAPSGAGASQRAALPQSAIAGITGSLRRNYNYPSGGAGSEEVTFAVAVNESGRIIGSPKIISPTGLLDSRHAALRRAALASIIRADESGGFGGAASANLRIVFKTGDVISVSELRR